MLIFGCRSEKGDFYYEEEWKSIPNLKVLTAFSRDEDGSKQFRYVQHEILKESQFLSGLILNQKAQIYVSCKSTFMPQSVERAFV